MEENIKNTNENLNFSDKSCNNRDTSIEECLLNFSKLIESIYEEYKLFKISSNLLENSIQTLKVSSNKLFV